MSPSLTNHPPFFFDYVCSCKMKYYNNNNNNRDSSELIHTNPVIDLIQTFNCLAVLVNTLAVSLFPPTVKCVLFIMTLLRSRVTSLRWRIQSESSSFLCLSQFARTMQWHCGAGVFPDDADLMTPIVFLSRFWKKKYTPTQPLARSSSTGYSTGALPSSYPHTQKWLMAALQTCECQTHYFCLAGVEDHFIIRKSGSQEVFSVKKKI